MAVNYAGVSVVKSGYLFRRTGVLKKWKRQWFTLTSDGILRYYDGELSTTAEDAARLKVECTMIRNGQYVTKASPPENLSPDFLLELNFKNKIWMLCADSLDDAEAWRNALEQARCVGPAMGTTVIQHQSGYGANNGTTVIQQNPGMNTTYVQQVNGPAMVVPPQNQPYPVQTSTYTYPGQQVVYSNPNNTVYSQQVYGAANGTTVVQGGPYGPNHTTVYMNQNQNQGGLFDNNPNQRTGEMALMAGAFMYGPMW